MKKLNVLLITLLILIGTVGCSSGGAKPSKIEPSAKEVLDKIQDKLADKYNLAVINGVLSDATTEEPLYRLMDINAKEETKYFISAEHFNADDIKEGYILEPLDSNNDAELIIVVKANNDIAADNLKDAMQKVLSDQHKIWSDHLGDQYQLVKGNKIEEQGNFVLYVTSNQQDEIIKAFQNKVR